MELVNEFTVNADIDTTWATLTDVERIAPCMPGAQLTEIEGDTYRGTVSVKVGPITAKFKGEANFVEQDVEAHKAVLKAAGRDTGGKGNASALITAQLSPVGDATHVKVTTDLTITGKVAQFGRGALADVSTKLIDQFVQQLETTVLNEPPTVADAAESAPPAKAAPKPKKAPAAKKAAASAPAAESAAATDTAAVADAVAADAAAETVVADAAPAEPTVRKIDAPEAQPIDLIDTAGGAMLKRLLPLGLVAVLLLLVLRRRGGKD